MSQESTDEKYMARCLQLAAYGRQNAKPNPMVGAVIVCGGRIIGEGYHVRCGEGHAEVNAFASVSPADEHLLPQSTMYVSLEPCSHYGKTPPCADLIVRKGVRRVVVGCVDPFARVSGRGIAKLREAGIEVRVGVLEAECRRLNERFMTVNTLHRPYIVLKWAQSSDGYIDDHFRPVAFSTPATKMLVHKLRAQSDAILVGHVTAERGRDPLRLVLGGGTDMRAVMARLDEAKAQSLLVEGGRQTLQTFIDSGLWDEIRRETASFCTGGGTAAPMLPSDIVQTGRDVVDGNVIDTFRRAAHSASTEPQPAASEAQSASADSM